jgi:F-type H+-transporting ATPase subunit b
VLVDGFTVAVQAINFLILVGLLSRFLFKPVLRAMDKREADIADTLNRARTMEQNAARAEKELQDKHDAIEEEREAVLAEARERAGDLERQLSRQARQEVDRIRQHWEEDLRREQDRFLDKVAGAVGNQVLKGTDRVLRDLSGRDLEQAILDRFLEKIRTEGRDTLFSGMNSPVDELTLRTTFSLDDEDRERVRKTLQTLVPHLPEIRFVSSGAGAAGIELLCDSHKISWNIEDCLKTVRNELDGLFTMSEKTA